MKFPPSLLMLLLVLGSCAPATQSSPAASLEAIAAANTGLSDSAGRGVEQILYTHGDFTAIERHQSMWAAEYHIFEGECYRGRIDLPRQHGYPAHPQFWQRGDVVWFSVDRTVGTGTGYHDREVVFHLLTGGDIAEILRFTGRYVGDTGPAPRAHLLCEVIQEVEEAEAVFDGTLQLAVSERYTSRLDGGETVELFVREYRRTVSLATEPNLAPDLDSGVGSLINHGELDPSAFVRRYEDELRAIARGDDEQLRVWLREYLNSAQIDPAPFFGSAP